MVAVNAKPRAAWKYPRDQFVVDLTQLDWAKTQLRALEVPFEVPDSSAALGLALVRLTEPGSFKDGISPEEARELTSGAEDGGRQYAELAFDDLPELDLLLLELHKRYGAAHPGETLYVGKNRDADGVDSSPHIGGGVEGIDPHIGGGVEGTDPHIGSGDGDPAPLADEDKDFALPRPDPAGRTIRVGVLDTKFYHHPDLAGRCLVEPEALILDLDAERPSPMGHSTFVAGLILQQAPNARLIVRSALNDRGSASAWDVAKKMVEFVDDDVAVLNMSFSQITADGKAPLVLERAVGKLRAAKVVLVAAAGNHGSPSAEQMAAGITGVTPAFPAALPGVIAVGATKKNLKKLAAFTPKVDWIKLVAIGENVRSTFLPRWVRIRRRRLFVTHDEDRGRKDFGAGYASWHGTSAAAGEVSGAIANIAAETAKDCKDAKIKAAEAVELLLNPPAEASRALEKALKIIKKYEKPID